MFGTVRKHQKWLWLFLAFVMSVSLVFLFTDVDVLGGGLSSGPGGRVDVGSINGQPIPFPEYREVQKEIYIRTFMQTGEWPGTDEASETQMDTETLSRLFLIRKTRELGVEPSDKSVGLVQQRHLGDYPFQQFYEEHLKPRQLTLKDFTRYSRNEAAIQQLAAAVSVGARLVRPADVETIWKTENQEVKTQLAVFWASNFLDSITITNGAIETFYTNRMSLYRLPERLTVSYVPFASSNYMVEAEDSLSKQTNVPVRIDEIYRQQSLNSTNAFLDTNGVPYPETIAKEMIRSVMRTNEAWIIARRAAADFGMELSNQEDPNNPANFAKVAAARGLTVEVTEPFNRFRGGLDEFIHEEPPDPESDPQDLGVVRRDIRTKAFALTVERPILFNAIAGRKGSYVIARNTVLPTELPPLEDIRDDVTEDYQEYLTSQAASKAGRAFVATLTNGLAFGKSFAEVCAANKVQTLDVPAYSPSSQSLTNLDSRVSLRRLQSLTADMEPGEVSDYAGAQPPSEGGYILYFSERPPIDPVKMADDLPKFLSRLKDFRRNQAFQSWFQRESQRAALQRAATETTIGTPQ
jgi:hypothetical protein